MTTQKVDQSNLQAVPDPHLDPGEFAAQFQAAAPVLWTTAAAILGRRTSVEDVLQEAAIIGLEKLDQFDRSTHFPAWMGRIVRFVALNHMRKGARRGEVGDEALIAEAAPSAPDLSLDDELTAALADLRPEVRAALVLKVVHELEYREISTILDMPEGTAMSHVHRAKKALRQRLGEEVMP